jgi:hypothetical protein
VATYDFDLFVIGAGSGGVRAGRMAASQGVKVAITEDRYMGGTCVNVGCVPKKLFTYAAHYGEDFEDAKGFGWNLGGQAFDWPTLRDNKNAEINRLNGIYRNLLVNSGCELIEGRGRIVDAHTVEVAGKQYTTERILVATGGWPFIPDFPGKEHAISSNEVFYLETFPKRAVANGDMVTLALIQGVVNTFVMFFARIVGYAVDSFLRRGENEDGVGIGYYIATFVAEIVFGLLASIIVAWFSRRREYRADEAGATLASTQGMIGALQRLKAEYEIPDQLPNQLTAFGINGHFKSGLAELMSSHPPLDERIAALQARG